ncbi:MAG: single-strand selective monofunctional uracil DNA glycosylase [Verrucomicrobiales bacterium]|jgi:single-strand selective monofunctional uracil DNA glycosylase
MSITASLLAATHQMNKGLSKLVFNAPVTHVYNPLEYGWAAHEAYLKRYATKEKRVVFLGMNPGPFGMAQTSVPFGEIAAVRDWMGIETAIGTPTNEHPKRPITGFACTRSEVSGRRLWGLFSERYPNASTFFADHFVSNYCPLVFMEETGRNRTPDKLSKEERTAVYDICDAYLHDTVSILKPEWVIGVGDFALGRAQQALHDLDDVRFGKVLHPSPASPAANRGWAPQATKQLEDLRIWK